MTLEKRMKEAGIDLELTQKLVNQVNSMVREETVAETDRSLPVIDGTRIIDRRKASSWKGKEEEVKLRFSQLGLPEELLDKCIRKKGEIIIRERELEETGLALLPKVAFGILNGGSASSYADTKKNMAFNPELYEICRSSFNEMATLCMDRAKGVTPGFSNPDGSPGASFLELKMRNILLSIARYQKKFGNSQTPLYPMFQMTSVLNNDQITEAYNDYRRSPLLEPLIDRTGVDITRVETGIQPLLAALTHSSEGFPRKIFTSAWGRTNNPLPFPGGHGQNFQVLSNIYRKLKSGGKLFAYLGNVDNLANTPDLVGIALLALSGKQAAFDFSFKTPVDVKGGILIQEDGRLNCVDIGAAVSAEWVSEQETQGKPILFNCATGLFNLEYLTENLDSIIMNLPLRITEQDKDPGTYAQTEQITWEILGMMDDYLVFGVEKTERFLAAKLLMENLITSGTALDNTDYPGRNGDKVLYNLSRKLNMGLTEILENRYDMELKNGKWVPGKV